MQIQQAMVYDTAVRYWRRIKHEADARTMVSFELSIYRCLGKLQLSNSHLDECCPVAAPRRAPSTGSTTTYGVLLIALLCCASYWACACDEASVLPSLTLAAPPAGRVRRGAGKRRGFIVARPSFADA